MLWTQNVWAHGDYRAAAYRCLNGHLLDPSTTRECPTCGVHDTRITESGDDGQTTHVCHACGARFARQPTRDV
jgi:NMD protein affecting ribosome stability and mRNA decay